MKTKQEIITAMCITFRHDYGMHIRIKELAMWNTKKHLGVKE